MKVVLDARMHNYSGIGRYIQFIIPFLLKQRDFETVLIGNPSELKNYKAEIIPASSKVYQPQEQLELFLKIPEADLYWSPHFNVPLLPIRAKKRLVTIHDVFHITPLSPLNSIQKFYARTLLNGAIKLSDTVITISQFTQSEMNHYFHLKSKILEKFKIIYHFPNPFFKPQSLKKTAVKSIFAKYTINHPFILYVGNVKPHKNILGMIEAFSLLKQKQNNIDLVIVGQKENFFSSIDNLGQKINELDLKASIKFTGIVNDTDLLTLYQSCIFLLLPSFYEGFGWPPLEAMACGCPVALSNIPVLQEIYQNAALYFDPYSAPGIASAMLELLEDPDKRKLLIQKGFKLAANFNQEKCEEEHLIIIKQLLNSPPTPSLLRNRGGAPR